MSDVWVSIVEKLKGKAAGALPFDHAASLQRGAVPLRSLRLHVGKSFVVYLNGAQGAGVMMVFSCITSSSRVGGGQPWTVFDASAREFCTVRETRTNTPLQSLNLMNDVTYIEAARMLAQRMLTEGGATPEARVAWAFRLAISRRPDETEVRILLLNLEKQEDYFRRNPEEAKKLLAVGEKRNDEKLSAVQLAAYSATASLILNLDEAITKQ